MTGYSPPYFRFPSQIDVHDGRTSRAAFYATRSVGDLQSYQEIGPDHSLAAPAHDYDHSFTNFVEELPIAPTYCESFTEEPSASPTPSNGITSDSERRPWSFYTPEGENHHPHPPSPKTPVEYIRGQDYEILKPAHKQRTEAELIRYNIDTLTRFRQHERENPSFSPSYSVEADRVVKRRTCAIIKDYDKHVFEKTNFPRVLLADGYLITCFGGLEGDWWTTKWKVEVGEWVYWLWENHATRQSATVRVPKSHTVRPSFSQRAASTLKKKVSSLFGLRSTKKGPSTFEV
ncbi:hypothetical protein B0H16DRAFT_1467524 [Mycena metata]|uniref:Uncharacterized protein n=1 Tax=Mycena metata TaxID=1033252 RepID=A0AAD7DI61_9AGAR|nr:hypothetical protein B0H16DRAFT_1486617 [Mycena metata]KAJ7734679.1 hypothetical protein B0H16DRAFT_1467524 [Mycena metata]